MQIVEERVSSLEETLERFILHVDRSFERQERFAKEMREDRKKAEERQERFAKEMREDRKKAEERQEKSAKEMCEDRKKAEERQEKSVKEMCEDRKKAEERQEKSAKEMKDFKDEMREARIKAFKLWGDAANRMGTLAEDIVAPSIREIGEKYFKLKDEDDFMVRRFKRKKADKSKRREFDVICVYEEAVILVEVKSTPRMQYIDDFIKALKEFDEYFAEYRGRKLIPIFASLYLPDEVIDYLTKNKIYAMATREDMMDLMNFEKVS